MNALQSPLVELPGRHTGVLVRSVGRPGTPEEGCTSSYSSKDQDTANEYHDFSVRSRVFYISCKKMSSFFGFQNINGVSFQGILTNWMNSMKKALKFEWSEDMEKDFKELKAEFTAGKILAYLNFDSSEPLFSPRTSLL